MKLARWDPFHELVPVSVRLTRTVNHSYSKRIEDSFGPWPLPAVIRAEVIVPKSDAAKPKPVEIKPA